MSPFIFNTTKSVVFENGAAQRLPDLAGDLLGTDCLLVTDAGLRKLGLVDATVSSLEAAGHRVVIFDEVEADPSRETLMKAVETGKTAGVTSVVGFGGGSSQDVAKLAALLLGPDA
ncbi:MAG: alcohol dehydrogenase, partial [Sulfitobacter sp.]